MEFKHTPGPWVVGYELDGPRTLTRITHNGRYVATAAMQCGRPSFNEHREANARLIAAAPELLHELLGFVNSLTSSMRNRNTMLTINHDDLVARIDSARATIAKALGEN